MEFRPRISDATAEDIQKLATEAVSHFAGFYDEDLIQTVIAECIRSYARYKPGKGTLGTWVWSIAQRRHIDSQRRSEAQQRKLEGFSVQVSVQVRDAKLTNGRPPRLSESQRTQIHRLKLHHSFSIRELRNFLLDCAEARKAIGIKKVPGVTVLHRAVRWAKRQ